MHADLPLSSDLRRELKEYILRQFLPGATPDELHYDTPLITEGVLDSLSTIMLVTFLEERYGIAFHPHEMDADYLDTIELIAATVEKKRA